ncbi:NADH ubiquinone oxidoreductase subunit NDUFA12-domain-containing protein [Lipomyces oligophaga]|uniref:NADH ubiquinone oxidoreductase subunit NDUFA12-domain-containing protein n=1 Tax=Lipomyces oligophaga TaxID=45792 RepID=UPI0034D00D18
MSSSIIRVIRNFNRIGFKAYMRQMMYIGDTKAGDLIGTDRFGNKYFENRDEDEIHLRTRWVEYAKDHNDVSQLEAGWHGWLGHLIDEAPNNLAPDHITIRATPEPTDIETHTGTPGAYVPYSTVRPKIAAWAPVVKPREI